MRPAVLRLLVPLAGAAAGAAIAVALRRRPQGRPGATHPVLAGGPLLIAHRGGAELAPENTLPAFRQAIDAWAADMVELDVRATADGRCVVLHDPTVDRTTDGTGPVREMTFAALRRLDAGYRFTPDGGRTFPFRGRGVRVPTIEEVLAALPHARMTVEVKVGQAQRPLFDAIRSAGAEDRVLIAAEADESRTEFDRYRGPKSASASELRRLIILHRFHAGAFWPVRSDAAQMPETWNGRRVLTPALVRELHRHDVAVHVWTVNDPGDMERLLDWGVDGLVTDRPDRLARVLSDRYGRSPAPALVDAVRVPVE